MNTPLGKYLKICRTARGLSQMSVCKKIKLSQTSLSQIETDDVWPSRKTLDKLLKLYNCRLEITPIT